MSLYHPPATHTPQHQLAETLEREGAGRAKVAALEADLAALQREPPLPPPPGPPAGPTFDDLRCANEATDEARAALLRCALSYGKRGLCAATLIYGPIPCLARNIAAGPREGRI